MSAVLIVVSACMGSISSDRAAHGDAVLSDLDAEIGAGPALAILVSSRGLHAIDPVTRTTAWRSIARPVAHPTADSKTIYVPDAGPRVRAISRSSGRHLWTREMPGEAFVGISAADGLVVAATTGQRGPRPGQLVGLDAQDGHPLWSKRTDASPGVPAASADWIALPLGTQLVMLDRALGRELARFDLPQDDRWQRAEIVDRHLAVSSPRAWLHLEEDGDGTRFDWDQVLPGYDTAAADPGHDDAERLRWLPVANPVIDVVVQMRRAVLGLRQRGNESGYDLAWLHLNSPNEEYVAATADTYRITLVSETGSIAQLLTHDGTLQWWWPRQEPTVGALFVGRIHGSDSETDSERSLDRKTVTATNAAASSASLRQLFADDDPRLDSLRNYVAINTGYVPHETSATGAVADVPPMTSGAVMAQGPVEPDPDHRGPDDHRANAQAVDPRTSLARGDSPPNLVAGAVRAMCTRDSTADVEALVTFVRLHHGDPIAVGESNAVADAVRCLLARNDAAADAVRELLAQPWSDARLQPLVAAELD